MHSNELPVPFDEVPSIASMEPLGGGCRLWEVPVALRVRHANFKSLGVTAPPRLGSKTACFTLPLLGIPSFISYDKDHHWLVLTMSLPGWETPTDLFLQETSVNRVDGEQCKGTLTHSSAGNAYMAFVKLPKALLTNMCDDLLAIYPDSRIKVRLSPRHAKGFIRWFPTRRCLQYWTSL